MVSLLLLTPTTQVSYARKTDWTWIGQVLKNGQWKDQEGNSISYTSWEAGQPDSEYSAVKIF